MERQSANPAGCSATLAKMDVTSYFDFGGDGARFEFCHLVPSTKGRNIDIGRARSAKSIAVLPFENLSDDKQNAYFAEGVQDEILTRLAKVADLKVISRTSTQHF